VSDEKKMNSWRKFGGDFSKMEKEPSEEMKKLYITLGEHFVREIKAIVARQPNAEVHEEKLQKAQEDLNKLRIKRAPQVRLACGTYSAYFIGPFIMKYMQEFWPEFGLHIEVAEIKDPKDFNQDWDLLLTGRYDERKTFHIPGTVNSEFCIQDKIHFSVGKILHEKMLRGEVLEEQLPIILCEGAYTYYNKLRAKFRNQKHYKNIRMTTDSYHFAFHSMLDGLGACETFSSSKAIHNFDFVEITAAPLAVVDRYFVINTKNPIVERIASDLVKVLQKITNTDPLLYAHEVLG